jgi:hypothetical protein
MKKLFRFLGRIFGVPILIVVVLCLCFVFWSYCTFGCISHGIAWLNGVKIIPTVSLVDIGEVEPGTEVEAIFCLKNLTNREILILGAESQCNCSVIDSLPVSIPSRTEIELPTKFSILLQEVNLTIEKQIHLFFDIDHIPVYLKVVAKVKNIPENTEEPTLALPFAE